MTGIVTEYSLPQPPAGVPLLRSGTIVWRDDRHLTVVSDSGRVVISAEWTADSHELTPDGRFVLALGDDGRRGAVWETHSGRCLYQFDSGNQTRQSLRAGLVAAGGELMVFVAPSNRPVSIRTVSDGKQRGWLSTTAMIWFHVSRVFSLDERSIAIAGYFDSEAKDTLVSIPVPEALKDPMSLYSVLTGGTRLCEWGYRAAIGPAGLGRAVTFRDPEWEEDDEEEEPGQSFRGLSIWELEPHRVVHRIAYDSEVTSGATIGADDRRIAVEVGSRIDVVSRETGLVESVDAAALDPYQLVALRVEGGVAKLIRL
jgi:hypothetical protein